MHKFSRLNQENIQSHFQNETKALFAGVNQEESEAGNLTSSNESVKKIWSFTSTPAIRLRDVTLATGVTSSLSFLLLLLTSSFKVLFTIL